MYTTCKTYSPEYNQVPFSERLPNCSILTCFLHILSFLIKSWNAT